jgi:transposase InsO family protein
MCYSFFRKKISTWGDDYNDHRLHSALGHLTPKEFIEQGREMSRATELQFKTV